MPWSEKPKTGDICKVCRNRNDCDELDCTQSGVKNMFKTGDLWEPSGWTCDHCGNHENDKMPVEGNGKNKGKTYHESCYKLFIEKKNPNKLGDIFSFLNQ